MSFHSFLKKCLDHAQGGLREAPGRPRGGPGDHFWYVFRSIFGRFLVDVFSTFIGELFVIRATIELVQKAKIAIASRRCSLVERMVALLLFLECFFNNFGLCFRRFGLGTPDFTKNRQFELKSRMVVRRPSVDSPQL